MRRTPRSLAEAREELVQIEQEVNRLHTAPSIHPSTAATSRSSGISGGLK
jgi:hypothetical protein